MRGLVEQKVAGKDSLTTFLFFVLILVVYIEIFW